MSAEHQLNDGKDNSDPPYQGELRSYCVDLFHLGHAEATISSAATLVIVAVQELCPWHWHPAASAAQTSR